MKEDLIWIDEIWNIRTGHTTTTPTSYLPTSTYLHRRRTQSYIMECHPLSVLIRLIWLRFRFLFSILFFNIKINDRHHKINRRDTAKPACWHWFSNIPWASQRVYVAGQGEGERWRVTVEADIDFCVHNGIYTSICCGSVSGVKFGLAFPDSGCLLVCPRFQYPPWTIWSPS